MTIPKLKRIKVSSETQLRTWLSKQPISGETVMLVTCTRKSRDKYLSREQVQQALADHGWNDGLAYTLKGGLIGRVIQKAA